MHRPGVELAISRSQVRRPNHYTTEPPRRCFSAHLWKAGYIGGKLPKRCLDKTLRSYTVTFCIGPLRTCGLLKSYCKNVSTLYGPRLYNSITSRSTAAFAKGILQLFCVTKTRTKSTLQAIKFAAEFWTAPPASNDDGEVNGFVPRRRVKCCFHYTAALRVAR